MSAARDRTKGIVEAMRAHRHAAPIGLACSALVGSLVLLGNPFASAPPPATPAPQVELRMGTAELSLPEPDAAPKPAPPVPVLPKPAPVVQAAVPVAPAAAMPSTPAPVAQAAAPLKRMGGGKRATIIVETLPAKPIIPPFKQPVGATPEPHPPLPLDTEIGKAVPTAPASPHPPGPKTAAASFSRDG